MTARTRMLAAAVCLVVAGASCSRAAGPVDGAVRHATPRLSAQGTPSTAPAVRHITIESDALSAQPASVSGGVGTLRAQHGAVVFYLTVRVLGLDHYPVRMGVSGDVLALGPGVYRGSAAPGSGHVITAGHDVTPVGPWDHGPYRYLERLQRGDVARIQYRGKTFVYRLMQLVQVRPDNVSVLSAPYDLTMTSCYPPGSAAYRLVAQWRET